MKKLKIATIVGTRPEIIRLSMVIKKLVETTEHTLIHTGQNYDFELNEIFFKDLGIKAPNYYLNSAKQSSGQTIGSVITETDKILEKIKPDGVLILGDTNSCMSAIPAKKRKIPIFHMEAGNRCFDQRVPEEINRRLVDHISDINLTYSTIARNYLINEGIKQDMIIKVGSPMMEVLNAYSKQINKSKVLRDLDIKKENYFVVSAHREENIDNEKNFSKLIDSLNFLGEEYKLPIIFSTHPRTKKRIDSCKLKINKIIKFIKPLSFTDYVNLQINSKAVLSDSGTISEESSILNFPAVNIREAHERPEAMEEGSVIMSGLDKFRIMQSLNIIDDQLKATERSLKIVDDYNVTNVSEKVVRIIHSYIDYVNHFVWNKDNHDS